MTTAVDLVSRGFFPKELPPPFTTEPFGAFVANLDAASISALTTPTGGSAAATYNLARPATLRRKLAVPNPFAELALCTQLADSWADLEAHYVTSSIGASCPRVGGVEERALERNEVDLSALSLQLRAGSRFLVKADVSRCYESIYTHSIPWALHTKPVAKRRRADLTLLGNRIDRACQQRQDGQTMGILIGPDSSLAVSEIVLCAIDAGLQQRLPRGSKAYRWVDDYEFGCQTRSIADAALATLTEVLAEFELSLNPSKVEVAELPGSLGQSWARELRRFDIREATARGERTDLVDYFDLAFNLARANPGGAVLSYSISRLSSLRVFGENWPLLHDALWQCVLAEPGTIPWVLPQLLEHQATHFSMTEAARILSSVVAESARRRHTSEAAWAIWAAIVLGVRLSTAAAAAVSGWDDPTVALLALDAQARGRFRSKLDTSVWDQNMNLAGLSSSSWPLAYEARLRGWLAGPNYLGGHQGFATLRDATVSFYDSDWALANDPTGSVGLRWPAGAGPYGADADFIDVPDE